MCLQVGYSHQAKPRASFRPTSSHLQLQWQFQYTFLRSDSPTTTCAQEGVSTNISFLTTHPTCIFHSPFPFLLGLAPILFHRDNNLNVLTPVIPFRVSVHSPVPTKLLSFPLVTSPKCSLLAFLFIWIGSEAICVSLRSPLPMTLSRVSDRLP